MRDSKICAQSIKTLTGSRFNCIILSVADGARGREFLLPKYYNNRLYLIIELTIRKQKKIRNKLGTRIIFFYFLYPNRYQVGKKINENISNHPCKKIVSQLSILYLPLVVHFFYSVRFYDISNSLSLLFYDSFPGELPMMPVHSTPRSNASNWNLAEQWKQVPSTSSELQLSDCIKKWFVNALSSWKLGSLRDIKAFSINLMNLQID